jgi:hypothetical protein
MIMIQPTERATGNEGQAPTVPPTPEQVPTSVDPFGRLGEPVQTTDPLAAMHWDQRLWRPA